LGYLLSQRDHFRHFLEEPVSRKGALVSWLLHTHSSVTLPGAHPELAFEEKQSAFLDARPADCGRSLSGPGVILDPDRTLRTFCIASDAHHVGATRARAQDGL
jgi:hypothetical protein